MLPASSSSIRLFRVAGIQVSLHWWWFIVAFLEISYRSRVYSSLAWNVAEYLGLFVIVLLHEFGHALACRQTGGQADDIVLWPFGGVAFVQPPQRPGAQLWSIAAGPLVNVVLLFVFSALLWARGSLGLGAGSADLSRFVTALWWINLGLLVFNLLPVYPLDGGQILRSLLWFVFGRARSLQIASVIGFIGIAALLALAVWQMSLWLGLMVLFLGQQCLVGYRQSQALQALSRLPRHSGFKCPTCGEAPPAAAIWRCGSCGNNFDAFSTRGVCPHCQTAIAQPAFTCLHCGSSHRLEQWDVAWRGTRGEPPIIEV
jgi:Zn-dependent protease